MYKPHPDGGNSRWAMNSSQNSRQAPHTWG